VVWYILKKLGIILITLWLLSFIVFILPRMAGDPVYLLLSNDATQAEREALRTELGLDRSWAEQYGVFFTKALHGDFGESVFLKQPVTSLIASRFPATVKLAAATLVIIIPLGILLGTLAAIRRNKLTDFLIRALAIVGQSLPNFWVGIMAILLFSVTLKWLPTSGMSGPASYIMPVLTLGWVSLASIIRLTRSSMIEVMGSDYISFLRARGIPERSIVLKHALKNTAIPLITMAALIFGYLLTGSIIVETVFAWPGMGRLAYESISRVDFPLIQAVVLFYGLLFVSINLLSDVAYTWIDPRIKGR
jgi:peptide/nickel transport system permease protein